MSRDVAIRCDGLTVRFGAVTAVDEVSFCVNRGAFFGFLGPNGAGKSTTVSVLCTLRTPTAGRAEVAGYEVTSGATEVRRRIGVLFQDPCIDDRLSGRENLILHARVWGVERSKRSRAVDEAIARSDLGDAIDRQMRTYSGGMRRRLELARVLLHEPEVLFLDEPTAGLDPQTRRAFWAHLAELRRSRDLTVVLTTHYLAEVEQADAVAILDHGRIVAEGSPHELKARLPADAAGRDLEDVFVHLTGHAMREEAASDRDLVRAAVSRRGGRSGS